MPHYVLRLTVERGLRVVTGSLMVAFTPGTPTDRLVFRLWPNGGPYARAGARLTVARVRERGRALPVTRPNPTTLSVSRAVGAGETAVISMDWRLVLPRKAGLRLRGGGRSARLASFFPVLAWDGSKWATDPPTRHAIAEAWTSPTADFDVAVTHPRGLRVFASGQQTGPNQWRAGAVRDFSLVLGHFAIANGIADVPNRVHVTAAVERRAGAPSPRPFLRSAITSLERYSALYAPYPWPSYTVVAMPDTGGLEYPTLVYQPSTNPSVAHETAHQWFYSLVGNDQARDPWLDEGLATWGESHIAPPPFADITIPLEVADRIGEPMTFWDAFDDGRYFAGVYLQSYRALLELGTQADVDCALRRYVHDNAYGVARPIDLLNALQAEFPAARQRLEAHGAHF
jgi:peptidase M1-like protein